MDDVGRCVWDFIFLFAFMLLAAFFSSCETAIMSTGENKLKKLSEEGNQKAKKLLRIRSKPGAFTTTINIYSTFCITGACCMAIMVGIRNLDKWFARTGKMLWVAYGTYFLIFLAASFLIFVLCQTLPKKLTAQNPEGFAFFCLTPLKVLGALLRPFAFLVTGITRLLAVLFRCSPDKEGSDITEEEIRMMVDAGNENGTIEQSEREMINNIFEFDDRTAGEVMSHRTDLTAADRDTGLEEIVTMAIETGYSRIPIYEDNIDNIVGILYAKDLLPLVVSQDRKPFVISDFLRDVIYVPESAQCKMLFKQFKDKKIHVAVVVDEYGGTAGIVTMEDLLESIVGSIQDEYDHEEEEIRQVDENTYIMSGGVDVEVAEKVLGIDIPETDDSDTLGGIITNILGRIPSPGETPTVTIENCTFTVILVAERRIEKVKVSIARAQTQEECQEDEK